VKFKVPKPYRAGIRAAEAAGWEFSITKKCHMRLKPPKPVTWPGGQLVTQIIVSGNADRRTIKNFEADLRRSGVDW
jgi:hypothetical protein